MGSSFGGTAAIMSSKFDEVDKVIALSPVVDWTAQSESEPMDWLEEVVKNGYGESYRFASEDWKRLSRGEFFQPKKEIANLDPQKIFLIHAQNDTVVTMDSVKSFIDEIGCMNKILKKGGHLSTSVITKWPLSKKMINFFG